MEGLKIKFIQDILTISQRFRLPYNVFGKADCRDVLVLTNMEWMPNFIQAF